MSNFIDLVEKDLQFLLTETKKRFPQIKDVYFKILKQNKKKSLNKIKQNKKKHKIY